MYNNKPEVKDSAKNLNDPRNNLSKRAVRGGFGVFALRAVQQLFNLARLIIIARILSPHDFGLMGIALNDGCLRNILTNRLSSCFNTKERRY